MCATLVSGEDASNEVTENIDFCLQ